ncbi:uncharacterized protein LOC135200392 [Macrobrachium nipponense]|uniref:uncharacterized protein LOC135200392 n=1 Tax=Macrobrachium nipponense TaxID=159736 RepID=UPI0030C8657A
MAFKGAIILFVISVAAFSSTSALVKPSIGKDVKKAEDEADPRLFFIPITATAGTDTSISISYGTIALYGLLLIAAIAVAIAVPIAVGVGIYKKYEGSDYTGTGYDTAPTYGYETGPYRSSIHRSLEDAAEKYN